MRDCLLPMTLYYHTDAQLASLACRFTRTVKLQATGLIWRDSPQPPFLFLDQHVVLGIDADTLEQLATSEHSCISSLSPYGSSVLSDDPNAWVSVSTLPLQGAILVKTSGNDCVYPLMSRATIQPYKALLDHIRKDSSTRMSLPPTVSMQSTAKPFSQGHIIQNKLPSRLHVRSVLPTASVQSKQLVFDGPHSMALFCRECDTIHHIQSFLRHLGIPMMRDYKLAGVPVTRTSFLENFLISGFIRIPYGYHTVYIVGDAMVHAISPIEEPVMQLTQQVTFVLPKTTCQEHCQKYGRQCDPYSYLLLNSCHVMQQLFDCAICQSGKRLIYDYKHAICETTTTDKLGCHVRGFGTSPCVCI